MTIRDAIDGDIRCCCTCSHDIRHFQGTECTNKCDIDGHSIGYVACFCNVCDEWMPEPYKGDNQDE